MERGPVEYRIERIPLRPDEPRTLDLVERLAEVGRQGWHVAAIDLATLAGGDERPVTVLLEREREEGSADASRVARAAEPSGGISGRTRAP